MKRAGLPRGGKEQIRSHCDAGQQNALFGTIFQAGVGFKGLADSIIHPAKGSMTIYAMDSCYSFSGHCHFWLCLPALPACLVTVWAQKGLLKRRPLSH